MLPSIVGAIQAAGVATPKATGGNEIKLVGSYWYHIFTSSGTFTPLNSLSVAVTSAGGGAGGGGANGGGGGAGALDILTSVSCSASGYAVTIGSFGTGSPYSSPDASTNGGTSSFALGGTTYVSSAGGGAGRKTAGQSGGSGGGGGGGYNGGSASGSNTHAGGNSGSTTAAHYAGSGGGGAGTAGVGGVSTSTPVAPGNGGQGYALTAIDSNLTSSNFTSLASMTYICSGAGGGALTVDGAAITRALGGTGAGNGAVATGTTSTYVSTPGISYGSGGGGGGWESATPPTNGNGSDGMSGVVIIRYAA